MVVRAATRRERQGGARPAGGRLRARPRRPARAARPRSAGAHVWLAPVVATYSIAACDLEARQWGVADQSKFLAVGSVVPWAEPEVGAIATQSFVNPRYGPDGLALLREGLSAEEVVERLTDADEGRDQRQLGVVDVKGGAATFTGAECFDWAGGRTGNGYAAQGNILVSEATVDALAETFERPPVGRSPSACSTASTRRRPRAATAAASSPRPARGREGRRLCGALRHRRRPARGRTQAAARGAAAYPRRARAAVRQDTGARSGSRSTPSLATELRGAWAGSATTAASTPPPLGRQREPRGARGRRRADRSRRARGAEEAKSLSTMWCTSTRSSAPRTWAAT